ncbi:hypothetical protein ACN9M0_24880 [Streptomyces sp. R-07]|uniref:hypothetical protein n=1 Tax=Streptomyces sp. R-07 TaxID=3404052 RepID=UPI003CEB4495
MTQPTTDPLRNLVDRAEHHGGLTGDEATRLRDGIGQLYADLDFWKRFAQDARAAEAKRTAERDKQQQRAERAEAALNAVTSPEAILAAALAISDYALTHLGRDLGTIHIEPLAEAGLRAALDAHTA